MITYRKRAHHTWRRVQAFNTVAALRITNAVGTMWCGYVFAVLALLGFPGLQATPQQYVQWLSQTFLQLTLLAVIMVGQNVQSARAEKHQEALLARIEKLERTHGDVLTGMHELLTDLHSHTTCVGHTTIGEPVPAQTTPLAVTGANELLPRRSLPGVLVEQHTATTRKVKGKA